MTPLNKNAARRERIRRAQHRERLANIPLSPRMKAKAMARQECIEQCALDRERDRRERPGLYPAEEQVLREAAE